MQSKYLSLEGTAWKKVDNQTPTGVPLMTVISDDKGVRHHAVLILHGNLWFHKDMSSYVYYTPTHWRFL